MKPDWTKAPKEPKPKPIHWDIKHGLFCDVDGWWNKYGEYRTPRWGHTGWGTDRYIPRPVIKPDWDEAPEIEGFKHCAGDESMKMIDVIPRRNRIDLFEPAEKAIYDAVKVVENAGAHKLLTDAINLLHEAKEKVSDFIEIDGFKLCVRCTDIEGCGKHGCLLFEELS